MKRSLFVCAALLACSSCFADATPADPFANCKKLTKPRPKPTLVKKYLTAPTVASTPVKKHKVKRIPPLEDIEYIDCPPIKPPSLLTLIPPPDVVLPVQLVEQPLAAPPAVVPVASAPCECATLEQPAYFVGYGGGGGSGFYGGGGGGGWASGGQPGSPPPPLPPVPEPAQWALLLAGMGCMLYRVGMRWKIRPLT